jgi:hypothetical protein
VEDDGFLGQRVAGFGGVVGVVEPDRNELGGAGERYAIARVAAHQGQFRSLDLRKLGERLGRQLVGTDAGDDTGQITKLAICVDEAGFFLAGFAEAYEFHAFSLVRWVSQSRKRAGRSVSFSKAR